VLLRQDVATVVLRPNAFMQTLRAYLPQLIEPDGSFSLPAARGASAWVDTRDIAAVAAAVLTAPPPASRAAYAVTGPAALTMHDVAEILTASGAGPVTYRELPPAEGASHLVDRLGPMGAFLAEHYAAVAAGGFVAVATTVADLTGRPARPLAALVQEDPAAWTARPA